MSNTEYTDLVKKVEDRVKTVADPATLNFMQFLTSGGVLMPATTDPDPVTGEPGDPIRVFLDASIGKQIIALNGKVDALTQEAEATHERRHTDKKANRYAQLLGERDAAKEAWERSLPPTEEDKDHGMLVDIGYEFTETGEAHQLRMATKEDLFKRVEEELGLAGPAPVTPAILELTEKIATLTKQAYARRFDVHLRGVLPNKVREYRQSIIEELKRPEQAKLTPEDQLSYSQAREGDELLAGSVMSIYNPVTNTTDEFGGERPTMDAATARLFVELLPETEVQKLYRTAMSLSYEATLLDLTTDAGFPGGHADTEGEPTLVAADQDSEDVGRSAA